MQEGESKAGQKILPSSYWSSFRQGQDRQAIFQKVHPHRSRPTSLVANHAREGDDRLR